MVRTLSGALGTTEVLPSALGCEIGCVEMSRLVDGYRRPVDALSEWTWLERHACLEASNAGTPDFIVRLQDVNLQGVPASLAPAFREAFEQHLVYLCVHHAAQSQLTS